MPRTVKVSITVTVPDEVEASDEQVASLVNQMLDVGYADAHETSKDDDIDNPDSELVTNLEFSEPVVIKV